MKLELQGQLVVQDAPIYSTSNNGFPEPHAINSSDKVSCSDKEKSNIEELLLTKTLSKERVRSPLPKCCKCHSTRHLLEDCLMWKLETLGQVNVPSHVHKMNQLKNNAISYMKNGRKWSLLD